MEEVTLVGIDLGKHPFHLHTRYRKGKEAFRRKVTRRQPVELFANVPTCTIAMPRKPDVGALLRRQTPELHRIPLCK